VIRIRFIGLGGIVILAGRAAKLRLIGARS